MYFPGLEIRKAFTVGKHAHHISMLGVSTIMPISDHTVCVCIFKSHQGFLDGEGGGAN